MVDRLLTGSTQRNQRELVSSLFQGCQLIYTYEQPHQDANPLVMGTTSSLLSGCWVCMQLLLDIFTPNAAGAKFNRAATG